MRKAISFTLILCIILTPLVSVQAMELDIPVVEKVEELPDVAGTQETSEISMEEEIDNSLAISDEVVKDVLNEEIGVTETQEIVESDTTSEENKNVDLEELEDKTQEDFLVEKQEQVGQPEQSDDEIEVIPLFEDEIVEEIETTEELKQPVEEIVEDIIENTPDENIEQLEDELPEIPDSMVDDVVDEEIVENIEDLELVDEELVEETEFSEELGEVGVVENPIEEVVEQQPTEQIPVEQQLPAVEQLPSEIPLITEAPSEPPIPEISMPLKTTIISNNNNYLSIENITEVKVVVTEIIIEGQNGWKQVSYNDNFKDKKIGTKEFGVRLNNLSLSDSYTTIERKGNWFIEPYETVDLEIEIITAGQVKQITEEIFKIKVMVDLAEYHIQTIATETINSIIAIEQSIIKDMVQEEVKLEEIETPEQIKQDVEVENDELVITEEIIETEEIKQEDIISQEEELKTEDVIVDEIRETENIEEIIKKEEIKDIVEENKDVGRLERVETPEENESLEEIIKSEDTSDTNISEEVKSIAPDEETQNSMNE